jgi:signal transduction histidine kinase
MDRRIVLVVGGEPGTEGGKGDQLYVLRPNHEQCEAARVETAGEIKVLGSTKDHKLCVQQVGQESTQTNYDLETFDGVSFEPLAGPPLEASLGLVLQSWFTTQSGDIWVSGPRGTAWRHEKKWRVFSQLDKTTPEGGLYFAELSDGKICCATREQLWMFDGKNWSLFKRGFERISSMARIRDGSLWVGANNGLYRWIQGAWLENGSEEGLPGPGIRELYEDARGVLWAGTTHGLSEYHPEADLDPPKTRILQPQGENLNIPDGNTITLTFSGQDKWKYTPRERLLYSYQLDQRDWSPFEEANGVAFSDLPVGKHSFQVRAIDRNGNIEAEPARVEFSVILPWYREARLMMIGLAGLGAALFFAVLSYNRHRKLVLSYGEVEKKVRQRTDELALANRELLHSQKMNALGTLAAGIAHDFNNILSIIKGSAQIIEENIENPDKIRTRVERINTVVEQGSGTVKALLGFSRDSDPQPGPCDLNAVVEDTIRLLGDRFLREVQVRFEPGTGLPEGRALKDFVQQILLNFIFNAAESMENEKSIVLSTRQAEQLPSDLVLKPDAEGPYVLISVRDHGCGIAQENLIRIFEPFFTTKALSTRRGTGLGLSMVYELARKMGSGLAVETVVGIGSTFTLIVPAQPAPAVARTTNEQR